MYRGFDCRCARGYYCSTCGQDPLIVAEENAAHSAIRAELQRYADAGLIEVDRWAEPAYYGHSATFTDVTGRVVGETQARLRGQTREWERAEIRRTDYLANDMIRIWLFLVRLPDGHAFSHLHWPATVEEDRFELVIHRDLVHDTFTSDFLNPPRW